MSGKQSHANIAKTHLLLKIVDAYQKGVATEKVHYGGPGSIDLNYDSDDSMQ